MAARHEPRKMKLLAGVYMTPQGGLVAVHHPYWRLPEDSQQETWQDVKIMLEDLAQQIRMNVEGVA